MGNVPLAAGYLILHARLKGLEEHYAFDILPPRMANTYSDCGLVEEILARDPWMVGFSCYLWNINRTLWICEQLKARKPELQIVIGGPEVTSDNAWVLESGCIDYAVIGEGEQTFSELLSALLLSNGQLSKQTIIPGLWRADHPQLPLFRKPLANLSEVSSPYLAGILNAADERLLLLETIRGCVFKCKFCYYRRATTRSTLSTKKKSSPICVTRARQVPKKLSCSTQRSISAKTSMISCVCSRARIMIISSLTSVN